MRYFVQHKFGVSKEYNTFNQNPWHGTGQGAANAALWYIVISDMLVDVYHSKIASNLMHDPTCGIEVQQSLKAFIDDVVLHATQTNGEDLTSLRMRAQELLSWWDSLVQVTGGALNPKKCCRMIYSWQPNDNGILQLTPPTLSDSPISLTQGGKQLPITILPPQAGTQYLGLYITTDQNTGPMEQHL